MMLPTTGEEHSFEKKERADSRRRKSDRLQHADLSQPLLDSEFEEERCQQERGDHQKETEVEKILAEVSRAARSFQALRAHGQNREAGV